MTAQPAPTLSSRARAFVRSVADESVKLFVDLLKVMVPVMVAVRIAVEFGVIDAVSRVLAPVMSLVGLPAEMGVVWATGSLVGTYAAVGAFIELHGAMDLTVAQASIIGSMLMIAHGLPIEQGIVRKAGPGIIATGLLRLAGAFLYGWILRIVFESTGYLDEPLRIAWLPEARANPGWAGWAWDSVVSIAAFFAIIVALIALLRLLDAVGFNRWLTRRLSPFLRIMKIDGGATSLTMIGVLLGIGFGGGLIIREAKSGSMEPRTVFLALTLMGFCHSLIEDTLVFMTIGADLTATLVGRILFSMLAMMVISRIIHALPDRIFFGLLFSRAARDKSPRKL